MNQNVILKNKASCSRNPSLKESETNIKTNNKFTLKNCLKDSFQNRIKNDDATKFDKIHKKGDIATKNSLDNFIKKNNLDNRIDIVEEINSCPECGSSDIFNDYSSHERICNDCGIVIEENVIDSTPSGTSLGGDGMNMSHHGGSNNIAVHESLTTKFNVNNVPKQDRARWLHLNKINNQSKVMGSRERNLSRALNELITLCSNLSLPISVRKEASSIYRSALDKDLVRGRSISLLLAASLYAACRVCRIPRTLDEISEVSSYSKKELGRNFRFLSRELGLKAPMSSPKDFIPRFSSALGLSSDIEVKSFEILDEANELGLIGSKNPTGVAAAALYCSCLLLNERRTQNEIAKATNVTAVTIRKSYKEMVENMNLLSKFI